MKSQLIGRDSHVHLIVQNPDAWRLKDGGMDSITVVLSTKPEDGRLYLNGIAVEKLEELSSEIERFKDGLRTTLSVTQEEIDLIERNEHIHINVKNQDRWRLEEFGTETATIVLRMNPYNAPSEVGGRAYLHGVSIGALQELQSEIVRFLKWKKPRVERLPKPVESEEGEAFGTASTQISGSEAAIWNRVLQPHGKALSLSAARSFLQLKFTSEDMERMTQLAAKARAGSLTSAESDEIRNYERVGNLLSLMQSKARQRLPVR